MTIVWIDGAPYNEFGEQLFIWRCDGTVKTGPGGGILLCPTYPCEEGIETACCETPTSQALGILWASSASSGGSGPGGSGALAYDGAGNWFGTIEVGTSSTPADLRVFCDGTTWKIRSFAPGSNTPNQTASLTVVSCSPLVLTIPNNFSTAGGWVISGGEVAE